MNPRVVGTMLLIIVAACFATGIIVYPNLPSTFVSHWNAAGQPNGTTSALAGVFLLPLIMLVFICFWAFLPKIDPVAPGFKGFRYVYDFLMFLVVAFLAYVYALTLGVNLGWHFNMLHMILMPLALLFFIVGALLPYIKRNWFVGIRTPWTISNDVVWNKTHKLGRVLFEIAAVFIFISAFVTKTAVIWLTVGPLLLVVLIAVVYSYVIFKRQTKG